MGEVERLKRILAILDKALDSIHAIAKEINSEDDKLENYDSYKVSISKKAKNGKPN